MRSVITGTMAGLVTLAAVAPATAQVVVLNGKSSIGSDSNAGRLLKVASANAGGVRVSIVTDPAVALICDERTPVTGCAAWVKAGTRIAITLRRPTTARTPPGQGAAPTPAQWGRGCPGTISNGSCIVLMVQDRSVGVDWSK